MVNPMDDSQPLNVLCFDGGGVRGLSSLFILRSLMDRLKFRLKLDKEPRPCEIFDLICGTSTGGLTALMLGRLGMTVNEAIKQYQQLSRTVFRKRSVFTMHSGSAMYDASLLEEHIKDIVKRVKKNENALLMDQGGCHTFVVAAVSDFVDRRPFLFRSYASSRIPGSSDAKIWEAARATMVTTFLSDSFTLNTISPLTFVDPTVSGANNPSKVALEEVRDIFPNRRIGCFLSLGIGIPKISRISGNVASIAQEVLALARNCERVHEETWREFDGNRLMGAYFRFSVDRGLQDVPFDGWNRTKEVTYATLAYIRSGFAEHKAQECIEAIKLRAVEVFGAIPTEIPTPINDLRPLNILCLDGGGVRGLSSLFILRSLMDQLKFRFNLDKEPRPCEIFDLICGTSTGGLIALMLGRLSMTVNEAIGHYINSSQRIFRKKAVSRIYSKMIGSAMYDASLFEEHIKDIVEQVKKDKNALLMDQGGCHTFVVAAVSDFMDGRPFIFRSYALSSNELATVKIWEAARATTATRFLFDPFTMNTTPPLTFMDASFSGANNPSQIALREVRDIFPSRSIGCFLSLGTGTSKIVAVRGGLSDVAEAYVDLFTSCEKVHEAVWNDFHRRNLDVYFRFSVDRGLQDLPLDEWDQTEAVSRVTQAYMRSVSEEHEAQQCIQALRLRAEGACGTSVTRLSVPIGDGPLNILCLDGGGVRGLSSLLLLRFLMRQLMVRSHLDVEPKPCEIFDLICGTSTGGLIALMLGRLRMSVDEAIDHYLTFSEQIFGKKAPWPLPKMQQAFGAAVYNADILKDCVKKIVRAATGDEHASLKDPGADVCRTFVVAVAKFHANSSPVCFRSYNTKSMSAHTCSIWEAARATTAATTFFDHITIDGQTYIDGALSGANNPSLLALHEAFETFPARQIGCFLSLGTGMPDTVSVTGYFYSIGKALISLLTSCEAVHDAVRKEFHRRQLQGYYRFSVDKGLHDMELDEWKRAGELTHVTQGYVLSVAQRVKAKKCAEALGSRAEKVYGTTKASMITGINTHTPLNVLCLDGGGVLGLSSLLILRDLMRDLEVRFKLHDTPRPCEIFDLICGTSTGGLVALMLGRLRMTVHEAIKEYVEFSEEIFGGKTSSGKMFTGSAVGNTSRLENFLREHLSKYIPSGGSGLKDVDGRCRTFVVAVSQFYANSAAVRFRSYSTTWEPADDVDIWKAARATTAMSPFFDPITFGVPPQTYIDGAFSGANNPSQLALDEVFETFPGRSIGCFLSLGTGAQDVTPANRDLTKLAQDLLTSCARVDEIVSREFQNRTPEGRGNPYFRFSVSRGFEDMAFDEWDRVGEIVGITEAYMRTYAAKEQAEKCVEALKVRDTEGGEGGDYLQPVDELADMNYELSSLL